MRFVFTGPENAPFIGREIDMITVENASLEDLAALQRGTKMSMRDIMARLQVEDDTDDEAIDAAGAEDPVDDPYNDTTDSSKPGNDMFQMQVAVFLALRTAGYRIHWRVARDMKWGDFDTIADDDDEDIDDETEDAPEDPQ